MIKLLKTSDVRNIIAQQLVVNVEDHARHKVLGEYLDTKKGKPANGITFKKLPENCKHVFRYGMHFIVYNDGKRETQHLVTHGELIGNTPFIDKDAPYGRGAAERIEKLTAQLADGEFIKKVTVMQNKKAKAINSLMEIDSETQITGYHFPAYYEVFGLSDEQRNKINRIF